MSLEAGDHMKKTKVCKDGISALPDDLLVQILSLIPTKDAITTMILSKRWRFVWTMLPKLEYKEIVNDQKKSVWDYLDKSLKLHKAPSLESLHIHLKKKCPVDADVGKWVAYAIERYVRNLELCVYYTSTQDPTTLPESFYTCKTLVKLTLVKNILIDVPSRVCLPSLQSLDLYGVTYKDEDSQSRLLSSCPVLKELTVIRLKDDNVTRFSVRVPSLHKLSYTKFRPLEFIPNSDAGGSTRFLVIDSPRLNEVYIHTHAGEHSLIENMPRLDVAIVHFVTHPNVNFLTSFSSVMFLDICEVPRGSVINFPRLIELKIDADDLEAVMLMLCNSPKLKVLMISSLEIDFFTEFLPVLWNQLSSVPGCLSHLEVFEWKGYEGTREEKELVKYILANSISLKTVGISPRSSYSLEMKDKITKELESMHRVSASSQLLYSAQMQWRYRK